MGDGPVAMAAKVAEAAEELRGRAHAIPGGGLSAAIYVIADNEQSQSQSRILVVDSQVGAGRAVF